MKVNPCNLLISTIILFSFSIFAQDTVKVNFKYGTEVGKPTSFLVDSDGTSFFYNLGEAYYTGRDITTGSTGLGTPTYGYTGPWIRKVTQEPYAFMEHSFINKPKELKDASLFSFALFQGKLYAFYQLRKSWLTRGKASDNDTCEIANVYACELNKKTLEFMGLPLKIYTDAWTGGGTFVYGDNLPCVIVSKDKRKLCLFRLRDEKDVFLIHLKLFDSFNEFKENYLLTSIATSSFTNREEVLSNEGILLLSGEEKLISREKVRGLHKDSLLMHILTISKNVISLIDRKLFLPKAGFISLRSNFLNSNEVISCGFFFESDLNRDVQGTVFIKSDVDNVIPEVELISFFQNDPTNTFDFPPKSNSTTNFFLKIKNMFLKPDGSVILVSQIVGRERKFSDDLPTSSSIVTTFFSNSGAIDNQRILKIPIVTSADIWYGFVPDFLCSINSDGNKVRFIYSESFSNNTITNPYSCTLISASINKDGAVTPSEVVRENMNFSEFCIIGSCDISNNLKYVLCQEISDHKFAKVKFAIINIETD